MISLRHLFKIACSCGITVAQNIVNELRTNYSSFYDAGGSIGRRYRRQDEAGTPFGVTVDHDTLEDNTVSLRERDTMNQIRVSIDKLSDAISDQIKTNN